MVIRTCRCLLFRKLHLQYAIAQHRRRTHFHSTTGKHPLPKPIPPKYSDQSRSPSLEPTTILFPYCHISDCGYNLVWTARPDLTGQKNYILYPVDHPTDSLPQNARNRLKIFTENSRQLLLQHNTGIHENKK